MRRSLSAAALIIALWAVPTFAQVEGDFSQGGGIRIGDSTTTCDAAAEGAIRYDSDSGKVLGYCNGTAWTNLTTGGGTPAGADREIQFNSGGAFGATDTFKLMADGDLLLTGTYTGTASVPATGAGTRMFFDTQKAAFRAGNVFGTQWDNASIGNYSTAIGLGTTASGEGSTALGLGATASGYASIAAGYLTIASGYGSTALGVSTTASGYGSTTLGIGTTASGYASTATGYRVVAGDGTAGSGFGDGSIALGLIDDAVGISIKPQVTGIQSLGIFMGDQDGIVLASANTMGLFGGKLVIDPSVPATNLSADAALEVAGDIQYTGVLTAVSDIRLKDNIRAIETPMIKLTSLHGLSYDKKSNKDRQVSEYGFAAQEVQQVFPELVSTASDEIGTLSVNYIGLIAPMVEALKEQQAQIDALEEQNGTLLRRLESLEGGGGD